MLGERRGFDVSVLVGATPAGTAVPTRLLPSTVLPVPLVRQYFLSVLAYEKMTA